MPERKLFSALRRFRDSGVEFIVVGGLAAVLNGAPIQTYDIDLLYSREPENVARVLKLLEEIGAIFRFQPERRLRPDESHLSAGGHLNLLTPYGPIDLLTRVGHDLGFSDLLPLSSEMEIGEGIRVRVLNLESVISIKEYLATEKDMAALPVLRQTLRELRKKRGENGPGA